LTSEATPPVEQEDAVDALVLSLVEAAAVSELVPEEVSTPAEVSAVVAASSVVAATSLVPEDVVSVESEEVSE
jgi:hypothetical protein